MKGSSFPRGSISAWHTAAEPARMGGGAVELMNKQAAAFCVLFTPIHRAAQRLGEALIMNDASGRF